ncbi:MAG: putative bifunctional diguanylate cyclase/phosphodiesterase [Janthinobacterium lividum]
MILFVAFPAALGLGFLGFVTAGLLARSTSLQTRLQELNSTLSTLLETAPVGIFSFVPGRNLGYWNAAAEKIFCLRSPALTQGSFSGMSPAMDSRLGAFLQQLERRLGSASEKTALKPLSLSWTTEAGEQVVLQVSAARVESDREGPSEIVAIAQDVTENFHLQRQLVFQARHDALTGLPNRLLLEERMSHMLDTAQSEGTRCAVLAIDLDRFKDVNDRFGHEIGDQFLIAVVKRLASAIRKTDALFRVGGDEFLLLIDQLQNGEDTALIARHLLHCLNEPIALEGSTLQASISVGIAVYPEDGPTTEDLRRNADAALYKAKTAGRNQYRRFVLDPGEHRNQAVRECLDTALEEGRFRLVFQPQYSTTGELRGFETLLRLKHPSLGAISPAEFIPLAEQSGLILPIGTWVLQQACAVQAAWLGEGLHPGIMAVNVSAAQFACPDLADLVSETLQRTGLPPEHLELELTESMVMSNAEETTRQMNRLERFGVRIAIDDFGIGYSSLSHLNRLPIGTLKIDRSFVQQLDLSNTSRPIVEAIVALGKTLSMKVVAEGVENENQRAILSCSGCDYLQGFLFAKPLEHAQAQALLMDIQHTHHEVPGAVLDEANARTLIM